jgi:hypothetical protein
MHVNCRTPVAILLLAVRDERGVLLVPSPSRATPGIVFNVKGGAPINDQLRDVAAAYIGVQAKLDIDQTYADEFMLADGRQATLYVATGGNVGPLSSVGGAGWVSIPELLRAMPRDRARLPYMRAWQVLSGGLTINVKAVAGDDADKLLKEYDDQD